MKFSVEQHGRTALATFELGGGVSGTLHARGQVLKAGRCLSVRVALALPKGGDPVTVVVSALQRLQAAVELQARADELSASVAHEVDHRGSPEDVAARSTRARPSRSVPSGISRRSKASARSR